MLTDTRSLPSVAQALWCDDASMTTRANYTSDGGRHASESAEGSPETTTKPGRSSKSERDKRTYRVGTMLWVDCTTCADAGIGLSSLSTTQGKGTSRASRLSNLLTSLSKTSHDAICTLSAYEGVLDDTDTVITDTVVAIQADHHANDASESSMSASLGALAVEAEESNAAHPMLLCCPTPKCPVSAV